jgi:prepilin-type N-terminal cleavage/methylation domain-containing protein
MIRNRNFVSPVSPLSPSPVWRQHGLTVLELMIVIAIIGAAAFLLRSGYRAATKADLVDNANELAGIMRRTSQLAIERGELHRVVIDFEKHLYVVEVCQGQTAIKRNEALRVDEEEAKRALERGKQRMQDLPPDALAAGDPDEAVKRASAIAGHHIADRTCMPASEGVTGDAAGRGWGRALKAESNVKFKEVWVQHLDESVTKGQVAIYFFPMGSAEKAVVEITDGGDTFTVLVHGLTGRIELTDGPLRDVEDHMLRNVMGDKDAQREDQQ